MVRSFRIGLARALVGSKLDVLFSLGLQGELIGVGLRVGSPSEKMISQDYLGLQMAPYRPPKWSLIIGGQRITLFM